MIQLIVKNEKLFALKDGQFAGQVINEITGGCCPSPERCSSVEFRTVFGGHGDIFHLEPAPPNPDGRWITEWSQVFRNPGLLPDGTEHVFLDLGQYAIDKFNAPD